MSTDTHCICTINDLVTYLFVNFNWKNTSRLAIVPIEETFVEIEILNSFYENVLIDYKEFLETVKEYAKPVSKKYELDSQINQHVITLVFPLLTFSCNVNNFITRMQYVRPDRQ